MNLRDKLKFRSTERIRKRLLFIGWNDTSMKLMDWMFETEPHRQILGVVAEQYHQKDIIGYRFIDASTDFMDDIDLHPIQEIYCTLTPNELNLGYDLSSACRKRGIRLHWVSRFQELVPYRIYLHQQAGLPIFSELHEPLLRPINRWLKRSFDLLISTWMILFCLSWMIPIVGLIIVLESRGPIFFRQRRTGMDNQSFTCYKFRTMRVNGQADEKQAVRNDDRITRWGKFLRHSSLDEFPQFINVFLGQMSIVGPRPHMLKHTETYSSIYGTYRVRHYVKPGITGWAQVNGCRGEINHTAQLKARIVRDIWYIEHWSFRLDLKILWLTFKKMIVGDKYAY